MTQGDAGDDLAVLPGDLAGPPRGDGGSPSPDLVRAGDGGGSGSDGGGPCTLGTGDHCGTCSNSCPPGADDNGTQRTCSAPTAFGTCDIICKGEYYDVNGKADDGCESQDLPLQDTSITAVVIPLPDAVEPPDGGFTTNPRNIIDKVYGDARTHDTAPMLRPNGREDWYRIDVTGTGSSSFGVGACLGITNFPTDNVFELCLRQTTATFGGSDCVTVMGMQPSACMQLTTDGTGSYYARVRKTAGTNTTLKYALFIKH
jgi:hypothetical protein